MKIVGEIVVEGLKMQGVSDNTFLGKQQEDIRKQEDDQIKERSIEDNIQVINDVKETRRDEEMNEKVPTFLYEKGLNENLHVKTLINTGLTDEYIRLVGIDKF